MFKNPFTANLIFVMVCKSSFEAWKAEMVGGLNLYLHHVEADLVFLLASIWVHNWVRR